MRVLIVEATRIGSESLAARLKKDHCTIVYAGTDLKEATSALVDADVALISASLEGGAEKGYEFAAQVRRTSPNVQIVILVDRSDFHSVVRAFRSGARGIFGRDGPLERISKCVSRIQQGQIWANNAELQHLLEALSAPPRMQLVNSTGVEILAPREQEVVHWVAEGLTNREIAEQLDLSANTVKNYLFRIFDKLGISSRVELILYVATQLGPRRVKAGGTPYENGSAAAIKSLQLEVCRDSIDKLSVPQYMLAEMYRDGRNVPLQKTTALMWFIIAESVSDECLGRSRRARQELEQELKTREVSTARQRAEEWMRQAQSDSGTGPHRDLKIVG